MKIIAVNIHNELPKKGALAATESAWKLNESKFRDNLPDFVIGVASGIIHGHYKFQNVYLDDELKRLKFSIIECNEKEIIRINNFINGKNLKYFVIKQKW